MSGHNKWTQIKHKKTATDQARGKLFSKLANTITIAARDGRDPRFNPSLKSAVDQAKKQNMPQLNIDRAINRASAGGDAEVFVVEVYGPEGVGVLVEVATDNRNRAIGEIRAVLKNHEAKIAERGSVMWSFKKDSNGYIPKFRPEVSINAKVEIKNLISELDEISDVKKTYSSIEIK